MSDSEPDWVEEQSSAQKLRVAQSRLSSSSSSSPLLDDVAEPAKAPVPAQNAPTRKVHAPKGVSASLPLQISARVRRDVLLFESVDRDLDLSGDFGCIGRLHVNRGSEVVAESEVAARRRQRAALTLDLKGRVYEGDIVPSNSSLLLVSMDGSKATVEALFSDFVQLSAPHASIFEMESVQQGEFGDGFFDEAEGGSAWGSAEDEPDLGPLKERRGGGKMAAPKKGSRSSKTAGSAKRKGAASAAAKRAKK